MQLRPTRTHLPSLMLALASGLGLILAWVGGGALFLISFFNQGGLQDGGAESATLSSLAWMCLMVGFLLLPALVLSVQRLMGREPTFPHLRRPTMAASIGILFFPPVLMLGNTLAQQSGITSLLVLPPLQILATGLPVWWLLEMGRRGLNAGSLQRSWGVVSFSILLTLPLILISELAAILFMGVLALSWLTVQPGLLQQFSELLTALRTGRGSINLLEPFLQQPGIIYAALAVTAGIIPMMEELLKPLAVWALAGRKLTPSQGFVIGLISGAVFALLESLGSLSPASGADWAVVAVGRVGTGLLHITCSGLVGYGLAHTWQKGRYLLLGGAFLLAVSMHGVWNVFGLLTGFEPYLNNAGSGFFGMLAEAGIYVLPVLSGLMLLLLFFLNRRLRRENQLAQAAQAEATLTEPVKSILPPES